jgi:hypothetical protein
MLREIYNSGNWVNHSRYTYTYDASGNETQNERENWVSSAWTKTVRYTYQFNTGNRKLTESQFSWINNNWAIQSKQSWTYNSYNQKTTFLYEQTGSSALENYLREFYYYEDYNDDGPTGIIEDKAAKSSCYPNPFTTNTYIDFTLNKPDFLRIRITDMEGRVVYNNSGNYPAGSNGFLWKAERVDSGVYFYEIKGAEAFASGKIVKQ